MSAAPASGTGTTLNVSNPLGTYYNMSAASASTSYSIGSVSLGGYAVSLINTVTEPTVVGATQIVGSNYITNRDMYLVVANNGVATQYWLEVIL
jgi:predicted ribonuclease toxin of YeeF-YezG toxin-antitoxin module